MGNLSLPNRRENKNETIAIVRRLGEIVGRNDPQEFFLDTKTVIIMKAN